MTALRKPAPEDANRALIARTINALTQDELERLGAWQKLSDLSSRTEFEGIDVSFDSIIIESKGDFEAIADVYLVLNYGTKKDEDSFSDGYVATIKGKLDDGTVKLLNVDVDTSSFYE